MKDRGMKLKERQKLWGLKDKEVAQAIPDGSIDTVRKLGRVKFTDEMLDLIEDGIERARLNRIKRLQPAG